MNNNWCHISKLHSSAMKHIFTCFPSLFLPKYSVEGEATLAERPHLKTFISLALCERATFPWQPSSDLPTQPSDGGLQRMTFESANARVVEMSSSQLKQVHIGLVSTLSLIGEERVVVGSDKENDL